MLSLPLLLQEAHKLLEAKLAIVAQSPRGDKDDRHRQQPSRLAQAMGKGESDEDVTSYSPN